MQSCQHQKNKTPGKKPKKAKEKLKFVELKKHTKFFKDSIGPFFFLTVFGICPKCTREAQICGEKTQIC